MRILGIDYGDSRVGIAVSDPLGYTAQGIKTLPNKVYSKLLESVVNIALEYKVSAVVIGLPKNMDGTEGFRADITKTFTADLKQRLPGVEFIFQDERLTTVQASGYLNVTNTRGKSRKNVIDTVAAEIILQSYLDSNKK
ncbi:MAG: Holliday junction resolvase RuvX [Clostridia bacterium]|nr:Holliday junction resolvase RuvX [Clostridia bacterium]